MEAAMGGACSIDGDWESICRMLSMDQDSDFINLLGHGSDNYDHHYNEEGSVVSLLMAGDGSSPIPSLLELSNETNYFNLNYNDPSQMNSLSTIKDPMENADEFVSVPKKRPRSLSKDALKGKKKGRAKKNRDGLGFGELEENQKSTNCYAESDDDESNDSQEGIESGRKKKKRAVRGAATDPQSLYARKRRERINERLRILQTLVPNGTKVDISTMLEDAVHYVKFLQMQIKLLSSDEMWMYAPLAYHGMDIGLYNNFSPYLQP